MNGTPEVLISVKGYIPWVGKVKRKRFGRKIGTVVERYQWVVSFMSCECTVRDHHILWITSLNSRVTGC
jgi:hypothetical protein